MPNDNDNVRRRPANNNNARGQAPRAAGFAQAAPRQPTLAELQAKIAELEAANAALAAAKRRRPAISMKVSEKGGLSLYGLGRFPVTLYRGQWETILAMKAEIEAFILDNEADLAVKE